MILSDALILPIAASNTASDDVTNYVTHRILIKLITSLAHFVVKIYEKI